MHDCEGKDEAEIPSARAQPLPELRAAAGLLAQVPALPNLLSRFGFGGRDSRSYKVELVTIFTEDRSADHGPRPIFGPAARRSQAADGLYKGV